MQEPDFHASRRLRLWRHVSPLLRFSDNKRSWGFLLAAAISVGLPVLVGAALGEFSSAVIASLGGLVILYMQQTRIARRMMTLAVCSFGFAVSFALGVLSSFNIYLSALTLAFTAFMVTLVCRFFSVPPPASFFFILVACIARTLPFDLSLAAERTGTLIFGCIGACLVALVYSTVQQVLRDPRTETPPEAGDRRVAAIILESAVISLFIGGGYLIALMIKLDNPYWVPVSTAAIMQGATFRAVWHRNVHRIAGTFVGMGLAWLIFSFSPNAWTLAVLVTLLSFMIEALVTRNYGLAVIFMTPLTVILADFAHAGADTEGLILARMIDITIGSCIGYLGGWVIHHPKLFHYLEQRMVNH